MRKEEIQIFVDGAINYFDTVSTSSAQIGTPYLLDDLSDNIYEYTGKIAISGNYKGNILFTAPKAMILALLNKYEGVQYRSELLIDLVGEIANTLSGNAREYLGSNFLISPPVLSHGKTEKIKTSKGLQSYCIPILWEERRANLIVAII